MNDVCRNLDLKFGFTAYAYNSINFFRSNLNAHYANKTSSQ